MNWQELNVAIRDMSEQELKYLIAQERRQKVPRKTFLVRLHQRYSMLRDLRERAELLEGVA
jgi:hypothetical protein